MVFIGAMHVLERRLLREDSRDFLASAAGVTPTMTCPQVATEVMLGKFHETNFLEFSTPQSRNGEIVPDQIQQTSTFCSNQMH